MPLRPLIAGNWKMNGSTAMAAGLLNRLRADGPGVPAELLVCPPATLVGLAAHALLGSGVAVGGQDCHARASGAHTGDISAPLLRDAGATHVILGHSERRQDHGETDALVLAKAQAAMAAGLTPIVCVGETRAQREAGEAEAVVRGQLAASLPEGFVRAHGIVAYEPVWAIGTGLTPTEAEVAAMHAAMRAALVARSGSRGEGVRLLYGGSVKAANAAGLLGLPDVDGALVGGASLSAEEFLAIARAAPSR